MVYQLDLHATNQLHIQDFLEHLWLEKGLSENTLSAYKTDLAHLVKYLQSQNVRRYSML